MTSRPDIAAGAGSTVGSSLFGPPWGCSLAPITPPGNDEGDQLTGVVGPIARVTELSGGMTSTMLRLQSGSGPDVVLRLMTREPRKHGEALTTRESQVQQMLAHTPLPVPRSLALDPRGRSCGYPAHLMSLLPGRIDPGVPDPASLGQMADLLAAIHEVEPTIEVRAYQSWAWEAKYVPPEWAKDASAWEDAFAVLRSDPPEHDQCFIHRDFGPRNVLWSEGQITGVVDWVETSLGPAWLDVAHCCTNLALVHSNQPADRFADAYAERTGRAAEPYFDIMDIVGFLPPPGQEGFVASTRERGHLEERLHAVLPRLSWR